MNSDVVDIRWRVIAIVIVIAFLISYYYTPSGVSSIWKNDIRIIMAASAEALGRVLAAVIVGFIGYFFARKNSRPKRVFLTIFILFFVIAMLGSINLKGNLILDDLEQDLKNEAQLRLEDPGYRNESQLPAMRRQAEKFKDLKNSAGGKDAAILNIMSALSQEIILLTTEHEKAEKKASTVFEFGELRTLGDIDKSIKKVKEARDASIKLGEAIKKMGPKLKDALFENGYSSFQIESTMWNFYKAGSIEKKIELNKINAETWKEAEEILKILKNKWGAWEYNKTKERLFFQSNKSLSRYNSIMMHISELAERSNKLQLEILKTQSGAESG